MTDIFLYNKKNKHKNAEGQLPSCNNDRKEVNISLHIYWMAHIFGS